MNEDEKPELLRGLSVDDRRPERPVLLDGAGEDIQTWRDNYPYDRRMRRKEYERTKRVLQIELLKLQRWAQESGARIAVLFEGRDAAGKGARSSASVNGSTLVRRGSSHWTNRPSAKRGSGTSSGTCPISPHAGKSCSSTAPGTTVPAWKR